MTQAAVVDISTRNRHDRSQKPFSVDRRADADTLTVRPFNSIRPQDQVGWMTIRQRLGTLASLREGWDGANGVQINPHTIQFVAEQLAALQSAALPPPSLNPSADGAIFAHWHSCGLDVEVIFEEPYRVIALIEDANGELQDFEGEDPDLIHTVQALSSLANR